MAKVLQKFYLYYTVNRRIGVAVSDRPDGTFADRGTLVTSAIDAHLFRDHNGRYYLYYVKLPGFRIICIDPMWFDADGVLHGKATRGTAEPAPTAVGEGS